MLFIRRAKCGAYARPWVTEFGTASYASSEACWWHNSGSAEINGVCQLGPLRERGPPLLPQFRGIYPPCTSPGWWYSLFEAWWRGNTLQLRNKNKNQQLFSWRGKWNKSKKMFQWRIQFALLHCFWFWFATQWKTASTISWSFHWFHCLLRCTSWFSMSFSFALPLMFRSFWLWMTPKLLCLSLFWLLSLLFSHQKPDFKQQFDVIF